MPLKTKLIYSLFLLAFLACKNEKPVTTPVTNEVVIPDSFLEFYKKFHADSTFQKQRIVFPLAEKTDSTKWTLDNWIVHKPFKADGEYSIEFDNFQDIIIEVIQDKQQIFKSERRFNQSGGEWHLIYYKVKNFNLSM